MPRKSDVGPIVGLKKMVDRLPSPEYMLNMTVVYDDPQSHKLAQQLHQRVGEVLGAEFVRGSWWNLADLAEPGVLAGAVSKAIRADMVVIAVQGSEGLPLPFYFWVNAWLPHRLPGKGALVALLGTPFPHNTESGRLRKFLHTVARRTRMDLLVSERSSGNKNLLSQDLLDRR